MRTPQALSTTPPAVPGPDGGADVHLTVLRPPAGSLSLPAIYFIHGGGMVLGDRYAGIGALVPSRPAPERRFSL